MNHDYNVPLHKLCPCNCSLYILSLYCRIYTLLVLLFRESLSQARRADTSFHDVPTKTADHRGLAPNADVIAAFLRRTFLSFSPRRISLSRTFISQVTYGATLLWKTLKAQRHYDLTSDESFIDFVFILINRFFYLKLNKKKIKHSRKNRARDVISPFARDPVSDELSRQQIKVREQQRNVNYTDLFGLLFIESRGRGVLRRTHMFSPDEICIFPQCYPPR